MKSFNLFLSKFNKSLFVYASFSFTIALTFLYTQEIKGVQIELDNIQTERIISIADLEFLEDQTKELNFEQVSQDEGLKLFTTNPEFTKGNFNPDYTYWIKISIVPYIDLEKTWLLEFYDQSIDRIEGYIPRVDGSIEKIVMGSSVPFSQRTFKHKNYHVIVPKEIKEESTFFFKITSSQKADVRIAIRSYDRFIYYALNEYLFYGLFYGMISIIAFYNLIVFLAVRELKYVYYIFYVISVSLFTMSLDGIGYQFLWPNTPEFNKISNGVFSFSLIFWAILFTIRFLNTLKRAKTLHYALLGSLILKSFYFVSGIVFNLKYFDIGYYDVLPFLLIFITGIYIWSKGHQVARLFVVAYGVLFLGALIKLFANLAIIEHNTAVYYSLHFAFLLEMILLSFALGDRIRIMKDIRDRALKRSLNQYKENIALKEKVNKELELKVKERTLELERKNSLLETYNKQLTEMDEQIKKMNSNLDKDNWKLKSSIKASLKARLTNKSLTFEEFKNVFPDASSCYRYLENLKWGAGFTCRKCNGNNYSKGPKTFTRRCSKCGFIDSVTAGTVFHRIRFPIDKAFYIAYTVISDSETKTLDQLSELLDLRKNTVWSFKKKVKQNIDPDHYEKELTWDELISDIGEKISKT
ncbi:7TM diverse intracellular signaling domain-containing protein [Arthrospiribacter ruber]|uniref:7TM diverse intracellular signaling domain-containing protein n=1 Tax=Arthrospiribacter ruber TaxID=2487934 RepID=UPI001C5AAAF0